MTNEQDMKQMEWGQCGASGKSGLGVSFEHLHTQSCSYVGCGKSISIVITYHQPILFGTYSYYLLASCKSV